MVLLVVPGVVDGADVVVSTLSFLKHFAGGGDTVVFAVVPCVVVLCDKDFLRHFADGGD